MCQFFCFACVVLTTTIASGLLYSLFSSNDFFFYLVSSSGDHFFHTSIISSLYDHRHFSFFSLLSPQNPNLEHRQTPSMLFGYKLMCTCFLHSQTSPSSRMGSSSSLTEDIVSVVHITNLVVFFLSLFLMSFF